MTETMGIVVVLTFLLSFGMSSISLFGLALCLLKMRSA